MTSGEAPYQGTRGFSDLLRRRRLAANLTQDDLAARAGIGVRTVRDLERGRSSRPQRTTVELLATALGLAGDERAGFIAASRGHPVSGPQSGAGVPAASRPLPGPSSLGLPAPTDLFGRDQEVADLADMLTGAAKPAARMVSLVGMAGTGKTSLALAVAARVADQHPGGVAGIVVTDVSTDSGVLAAVAAVFGIGRAADLAARLAGAPTLLLVDAVERAPDAVAAALRRLARTAPALRILTTGRHPVGLPGERVWTVAPLEVPPAGAVPDLDTVSRYPATGLFRARLGQVRRDPLEPDEIPALIDLVRRLGGLPLAIELAAARGRILRLNEMLTRYGDRVLDLDLTDPPPSRAAVTVTLRDAVAGSYRLLSDQEQACLRRLSAFRNRWCLDLAEAMLAGRLNHGAAVPDPWSEGGGPKAGDVDPVPLLDRLMALGLLSVRGTSPFRFRLIDVVRDFATEQAAASGELNAIRRRHAILFARLAARIAPELTGANLTAGVARLDEVTSDLWAALAHSANDDPHTALGLAAHLARWWRFRGRDVAGRQWLRRLLDDPRTSDADPVVRAWAQVGVAQLAAEHGAGQQELPTVQAALAQFQAAGAVGGELAARNVLCALLMATGGYEKARQHGEAVLALATRLGRVRDMAVAQNNLTWHEIRVGDLAAARRRLAAVDQLSAECGDERLRVLARANLAEVARLDGRYGDALTLGQRVLPALDGLGDPGHRRRLLATIGLAFAQDGQLDEGAAFLRTLRAEAAAASALGETTAARATLAPVEGAPPAHRDSADGDVLNEFDGAGPPGGPEAGACASIEATIALRRGDRGLAAEWFTVAARAYAGDRDLRDVAEALVGLVASMDDPAERAVVVGRLERVCRQGAITLLPRERALIHPAALSVPQQRGDDPSVASPRRAQPAPPA